MESQFCIIVPHFNHGQQLASLLPELLDCGLPLIIVDDGSDPTNMKAVEKLVANIPQIRFEKMMVNQGKGAAVIRGIQLGNEQGFTHAIQIDADGQHKVTDIPRLITASNAHPESIVSGLPQFGEDIPKLRLYGRKFSLWWSRLETLSFEILDAMCGFRVYPIPPFLNICNNQTIGQGMQFDTEILVRSSWRGQPIQFVPIKVKYPPSGISHFHMLRDNMHISWMHTRLVFGMLLRLPRLIDRMTTVHQV
jgi:glycosyltransferase involved in cell wall biosynthesis